MCTIESHCDCTVEHGIPIGILKYICIFPFNSEFKAAEMKACLGELSTTCTDGEAVLSSGLGQKLS
jgi:hypothetical protein